MSDEQIVGSDEQIADTAVDESLQATDTTEDDPNVGDGAPGGYV